jgi:putative transposase
MARLNRLTVTGYPHHVILRGNNRQTIFRSDEDQQVFYDLLLECSQQQNVEVHAYVLMTNHVHLLMTPQRDGALSKMMQAVARRYVQYFNRRYTRTGTLWDGRYRSTLIQADRYMLACMVYIDLNPVRAHLVAQPLDYRWSSHSQYVGPRTDRLITPHAIYWALGNTPFAREAAYTELVRSGITREQQAALVESTVKSWALGDASFVQGLQTQTPRRLLKTQAGRPHKKPT